MGTRITPAAAPVVFAAAAAGGLIRTLNLTLRLPQSPAIYI